MAIGMLAVAAVNQNRPVFGAGAAMQTTTLMTMLIILMQMLTRMSEMEGKLEGALGHEKRGHINQIQGNGNIIINGPVTIINAPPKAENRPAAIELPKPRRFEIPRDHRDPRDPRILGSIELESKPAFFDGIGKRVAMSAVLEPLAPIASVVDTVSNAKIDVSGSAKAGPASGSFNFKFGE